MVTTQADRHEIAALSVEDFLNQDWPHKDIVILNSTGRNFPRRENVFEIPIKTVYPGLWEFGLTQCEGEWIADWQDDCRYDSSYLRLLARYRKKEAVVRLQSYLGRTTDTGESFLVENSEFKFWLFFRFNPKATEILWRANPQTVTRFYAGKQA